ncbi:hypothetical protein KAFR_0B05420 [Kazachstania africana CBS 2517]|uniref:DNA polymerase epsilon subunit D n=1 Tax=Kazachstania africana (strain ATCC 22294 / BCRC 22015 / CBS 2517 / CECT 1963 / NBRC 1671 / NRRL Y-8276) TaxID=1071382 RepID=H2AR37_KAZAF|nr:hypothetical protein KAFR_0B05420 [Kazachstania africana CBS 2517]CCF56837.1 hypothetical protein KAFR_0B05420 [Kazachstania africana CBS 2517]
MPPKGWRKDAQGNYPTTSYIKEQENITIDDLLFPKSIIVRLAKEVQDANNGDKKLVISKDASLALQRSATVFVNHLLLFAREIAREQDKKSCNSDDVLNALDHIGLPGLKALVVNRLDDYQKAQELKRQNKKTEQRDLVTQNDVEENQLEENDEDINKRVKLDERSNQTPAEEETPIQDENQSVTEDQDTNMLADES